MVVRLSADQSELQRLRADLRYVSKVLVDMGFPVEDKYRREHPIEPDDVDACFSIRERIMDALKAKEAPIPMLLWCPECGERHLDLGEFAKKPHKDHACQSCGMVWRPAKVPTCGVQFLPGYKNE